MTQFRTFTAAQKALETEFKIYAQRIHTKKWQGQDISLRPDMVSWELLHVNFRIDLGGVMSLSHWQKDISPNLPWADDHFLERVSGVPLNPGIQWESWPWASSADKHRTEGEMFNHTYMERLWPRYAGKLGPLLSVDEVSPGGERLHPTGPHIGIRGQYGDLRTLVDMLAWDPDSRQAYIPLYFPEDTGLDGRKPCTLGYQFILREGRLHLFYPLRSCDFVRHWGDDCYLAVRLLLWMIEECRKVNPKDWEHVTPGVYVMHMTSLHVFANDAIKMGLK